MSDPSSICSHFYLYTSNSFGGGDSASTCMNREYTSRVSGNRFIAFESTIVRLSMMTRFVS